jgi:deoxyribodipyrimidine photo-lyase
MLVAPCFTIMEKIAVFWHRRDLRCFDNAGLYHALKGDLPVLPLFIFDTDILAELDDRRDARVTFIHDHLHELAQDYAARGGALLARHGSPPDVWRRLLEEYDIGAVYTNRDYEPYAIERDAAVEQLLAAKGIPLHTYKDHVIFEKGEVMKDNGEPYTVFTPYSRKWRRLLTSRGAVGAFDSEAEASFYLQSHPSENYLDHLLGMKPVEIPSLRSIGFERSDISFPPKEVPRARIRQYDKTRDFPGMEGTSRLGVHFRFGTISIREKARHARTLNDTYLNELIWRDFYAAILAHFPHVATRAFRPEYDAIAWRNDEAEFELWRQGCTGYPIVDAGMRELQASGYMHNRVRMITASFLTKHLLIDWRWGEAHFAKKLLDFDLASNNGGWQWAAGSGTDAAPYFRIFNPWTQQEKFDPKGVYIKKWAPEYGSDDYPPPMVDHKMARERALAAYKEGLSRA